MKRNLLVLGMAGILVLGACLEVWSQELLSQGVVDEEEVLFLELPVVTATMEERTIKKSPSQIYSWSKEDIWKYGLMDINDLLAHTPGWFPSEAYRGDYPAYTVRGYHAPHAGLPQCFILFLEDFYRLNETSYYGHFYGESLRDLNQFERVEVVNGPGGALYGDNAIGGVVNAISKKVLDGEKSQGVSQVSYQSGWNKLRAHLGYCTKFTDDILLSMTLYQAYAGKAKYSHGLEHPAVTNDEFEYTERTPFIHKEQLPWNEDSNKYDLPQGNLSLDFYDFNLKLMNHAVACKGVVIPWDWVEDMNQSATWRVFGRKGVSLSYSPGELRDSLNPIFTFSTGKFYDQRTSKYCDPEGITDKAQVPPGTNWKARVEDSMSMDFQCKPYRDEDNRLLWKVVYCDSEYEDLYLRKTSGGTKGKCDKGTYKLKKWGMLGQWENFALQNLIFTTGLRLDYTKADSKAITDGKLKDSITTLTPRFAVNYIPTDVDSIRFIYARSARQIPAFEFGLASSYGEQWAKKDVTDDFELNYTRDLGRNNLISANLFYMNSPATYVLMDPLYQRTEMKSKGVELLYKHRGILVTNDLEISATCWDSEIQALKKHGIDPIPDIPEYMVKLKYSGRLLPNRLNYSLLYRGNFNIDSCKFTTKLDLLSKETYDLNFVDLIFSSPLPQKGLLYRFGFKNLFNSRKKEPGVGYNTYGDDLYRLSDSRVKHIGRTFFLEVGSRF